MKTSTYAMNKKLAQWLVIATTAAALLLGLALKASVLGQTRGISEGGVQAEVPVRWVVETVTNSVIGGNEAFANRVFSTWDPLAPGTRYIVNAIPSDRAMDLATSASLWNLEQAQNHTAYRVTDQTPVTINGRNGYKVVFAYVDAAAQDRVPVVYEGTAYFFEETEHVLVVSLETYHNHVEALEEFRDFAVSVQLGGSK
jgi:hypothetical protein